MYAAFFNRKISYFYALIFFNIIFIYSELNFENVPFEKKNTLTDFNFHNTCSTLFSLF